jgi:uncharacterized repeat protein (TIGR02543 family)
MKKISTVAAIIILAVALALFSMLGSSAASADAGNEYIITVNDNGNFVVSQGNTPLATANDFSGVLDAVEDGATLVFGKDGQTINTALKTLSFNDGRNYTLKGKISGSASAAVVELSGSGNLTIEDAVIANRLLGDTVMHQGTGTLTIQGGTVLSSFIGRLIVNNSSGLVVVNGGTYTNGFRNIINVGAGTVTLNGGVFSNTGFTNVVYNAGSGTVNIGGTAELYSGASTRTVHNISDGTVNISGNAVLKHYSFGTVIDEEGVITGDIGKINNFSVYNSSSAGKINISGSPDIKGKFYILSPLNVSGNLSSLPTPLVIQYGDTLSGGLTMVTNCSDSSLFRLDSKEYRLAASGNNLTIVGKTYYYSIYNMLFYKAPDYDQNADKYLLTADGCILLKASTMDAVAKYIKDDSFDADETLRIFFRMSESSDLPLRLKDGDSFIVSSRKTYEIGGAGITNGDASVPLITVNDPKAEVSIVGGTYDAAGLALQAAEGSAILSGSCVFRTQSASDEVIKVEQDASVTVDGVSFAAQDRGEMSFYIVSDELAGNSVYSVQALVSYSGEESDASLILNYGFLSNTKEFVNTDGVKRYDFSPVDFLALTSVTTVLKNDSATYKITYNLNDGTGSTQTDVYYAGLGKSDLLVPVRTGYSFDGWYGYYIPILNYYGNAYTQIPASQTGNITLYAKWTFGAPVVTIPSLSLQDGIYSFEQTFNGQHFTIVPDVTHSAGGSEITYNYSWAKGEGNTYSSPISSSAALKIKNVVQSGTYRLSVTATQNGNTSKPAYVYVKVTILPLHLIPKDEIVVDNKVYDGSDSIFEAQKYWYYTFGNVPAGYGSGNGYVDYTPRLNFDSEDVGVHKAVTFRFSFDDKNFVADDVIVYADITPRQVTVSGMSAQNKVYDGTTQVLLLNGTLVNTVAGDQISFDRSGNAAQASAGTHPVTTNLVLTGEAAKNYTLVQPDYITVTIYPKSINIVWGPTSFVYNGQDRAPSAYVEDAQLAPVDAGSIAVAVNGARRNAAQYEYLAQASVNSSNYVIANADIRFSIVPLTAQIDWGTLQFVYNGTLRKVTPAITNLCPGDENVSLVVSNAYQTGVGNYTAVITDINSLNYILPAQNLSAEYTILPLVAQIDWGMLEFAYDGTLKKVNPVISNLCAGDENVTLIVTNASQILAGNYVAQITGISSSNYILPPEGLTAAYSITTNHLPLTGGIGGNISYSKAFGAGTSASLSKKSSNNNSLLNAALKENQRIFATYNLSLLKDGALVSPDGLLTVSFEVKNLKLLRSPSVLIVENGVAVQKAISVDGNIATFTTTSTGDFLLVYEKSNIWIFAGMVIGGLGIIFFLIAVIRSIRYKISFITDGSKVETIRVRAGEIPYLLPSYKEDFVFRGWYKDSALTTKFTATRMPRKNIRLYAAWEPKKLEGFDLALKKAGDHNV